MKCMEFDKKSEACAWTVSPGKEVDVLIVGCSIELGHDPVLVDQLKPCIY